jgi:inosine-uridine nucleoside N-ribohydrolase
MKQSFDRWRRDRRMFLQLCTSSIIGAMLKGDSSAIAQTDIAKERSRSQPSASTKTARVIIDTDPGVDDAFALMLALRSPELRVEAITAVAGNLPLEITLSNALRLVEICERTDIPVAGGASGPLVRHLITAAYAHGENGLGGVDFPFPRVPAVKEHAVDLICRIVNQNPGEITLIGLAPLTNLALALRSDPNLFKLIRSIVIMGGSLSGGNVTPSAEFNFYVDPEAASIVFASGVPISMVGLDVTRKVELTHAHIKLLESGSSEVSRAAARIARAIMDRYLTHGIKGGPNLHDPLAVSSLLDPDILTFEDYQVQIETAGITTAGESVGWRRGPIRHSAPMESIGSWPDSIDKMFTTNAKVATNVDAARFFQLLIGRLAGSTNSN